MAAAAAPALSQAAAQRRIEALEQALELENKRRHEEELRALLEGAPFVLHRGSDRTARHVWVADVPERGGAMLRWQSNKGIAWARSRTLRSNLAKLPYHEASVSLLTSVTYGVYPVRLELCRSLRARPCAGPLWLGLFRGLEGRRIMRNSSRSFWDGGPLMMIV